MRHIMYDGRIAVNWTDCPNIVWNIGLESPTKPENPISTEYQNPLLGDRGGGGGFGQILNTRRLQIPSG